MLQGFGLYGKMYKRLSRDFVMYGDLYMGGGMAETSDEIAKNVKKIAKKH